MKKRILSIMLIFCMVLMLVPQVAFADETYGDFTYTVSGNKVTITKYTGSGDAVEIPNKINEMDVTSIGNNAFYDCTSLTSITIPESVTSIGNEAFENCYDLKSVTFRDNSQLQTIGDYAFFKCQLTSINIPGNVTSIGSSAFHGCYLTSINIPGSVTSIGSGAFRCAGLTSITVASNNSNYSSVDGVLFNKDKTELIHYPAGNTRTSYSIPNSVVSIVNEAFRFCKNLESVAFGADSKLQSIGKRAFEYCEKLERINIPSSVTNLGEDAFFSCTNLKSIIIPDNVTVINDRTFSFCNNLESIFLPDKDNLSVGIAAIPGTTTQVKYSLNTEKKEVTITEITLGTDKTGVTIPATICGYPVVAVADGLLSKISSHTCTGGEATCQTKATCEICKQEYGEVDSSNHNLEKISAKDATVTETGYKDHWQCKDCKKYFSDANAKTEIGDLAAWKTAEGVIVKLQPAIIEGKEQSLTAGEKKELTFRSNAAFSDFIRVELDGKILDEKNYTKKEGSIVVTLNADYVATLSAGEHTIGIVSESGTASTTFAVNAKVAADNGINSPQTEDNVITNSTQTEDNLITNSPQTGDNIIMFIIIFAIALTGILGIFIINKKKVKNNK